MRAIRAQIDDFGGTPRCSLIGAKKTSPDRAALYNSALVRYLDFNDSYLAKGETCHPSDNLGAVLAASEYANCSGKDLIAALAVAYQVRCRLSDVAPVRAKGFDHTVRVPMPWPPAAPGRWGWARSRPPTPSPSAGRPSTPCG